MDHSSDPYAGQFKFCNAIWPLAFRARDPAIWGPCEKPLALFDLEKAMTGKTMVYSME